MHKVLLRSYRYLKRPKYYSSFSSTATDVVAEEAYPYKRSEYATKWYDPNYPEWQQFLELGSKREYYHNRKDNSVSWTHPSNPDPSFDIISYERTLKATPLKEVPEWVQPASLGRRATAFGIDIFTSTGAGCIFALGVYADLGDLQSSIASVGFSTWFFLIGRDIIFEQGTRSIGKRVMKLEIVTNEGRLPSRYNNFFRQIYIPLYAASTLLMPYILALPVLETGLLLFTKDQKRLGDWIGRTRVINEQSDRVQRLEQKKKIDEAEELLD